MIIKTISRKSNVDQLIRYVLKDEKVAPQYKPNAMIYSSAWLHLTPKDILYMHKNAVDKQLWLELKNVYHGDVQAQFKAHFIDRNKAFDSIVIKKNIRGRSIKSYITEFEKNEKQRVHVRKDNVKAYHTIISFSGKDRENITDKMLKDIAMQYMTLKGNALFIGAVHYDKDHAHIHLVESGVQYITGLSNRVSKHEFNDLKLKMAEYQQQRYPELSNSLPDLKKAKGIAIQEKEGYKNIKTDERFSKVNSLLQCLDASYSTSKSPAQFFSKLRELNIEPYERGGKMSGVRYEGLKFRFSRLGYADKLKELDEKYSKNEKALEDIKNIRNRGRELGKVKQNPVHDTRDRFQEKIESKVIHQTDATQNGNNKEMSTDNNHIETGSVTDDMDYALQSTDTVTSFTHENTDEVDADSNMYQDRDDSDERCQ